MFDCLICGRSFKSASGLGGHKRLVHGSIGKRELPDNEVLAVSLEEALDSIGELREGVNERLGGIEKAIGVVQDLQRKFAGTLNHNNIKPNAALLDHWGQCADCERELALLQNQLAGLILAPTPPPAPAEPTRWRKESKFPWEEPTETVDPEVAAAWRLAGDTVEEVKLPATPPPEAVVKEESKYPWDDKKE
jgi:hypothetical protein